MIKRVASIVTVGVVALVLCVRCSEPVHQCGLDINCGDPEGLKGTTQPGPPTASGASDTNNNMDTTTTGDGGAPAPLCTPLAGDGGCAVSFKNDILGKKLGAAGAWGCAAAGTCHDPGGTTQPLIDVLNATTTYKNLYNTGISKHYINPCSVNPDDSEIVGNLTNPAPAADGQHMPLGDTTKPTQGDIDSVVKVWVACGAPFN